MDGGRGGGRIGGGNTSTIKHHLQQLMAVGPESKPGLGEKSLQMDFMVGFCYLETVLCAAAEWLL